jgi:hypothetical protein
MKAITDAHSLAPALLKVDLFDEARSAAGIGS